MQFHLNGFRPGDPAIANPAITHPKTLPPELDVLIVGCGPAGLTLAAQLAQFPDITTRIVEQKPGPLSLGQADGIACRTIEMFQTFGFAERVLREAYWVNLLTFWKPGDDDRNRIVRTGRNQDTEDGLSEFPHVILNQARIHDFYLDTMRRSPTALEPDYNRRLIDLAIDRTASHPVTVRLDHDGDIETLRARFVVGCDGARSAVRKSLGLTLQGDSANQAWGVMDVLAVSDFPDFRVKAAIQSAHEGSALIIPREGGYLVRLYIELDQLAANERVANRNITPDRLIEAAQRILRPYTLDVKEIAWWSVYEIGQRLCDRFDDTDAPGQIPCVFIAGDACHTHSPKAGQGMNVSMQDGFNLGWKLAAVLRGQARPELLRTYSAERHAIAAELIDFDRKLARMFSAKPRDPADPHSDGVDPAEFQRYLVQQGRFTAGTATRYTESLLTGPPDHQHLAAGFPIGMRFHSAPVIRLADAKPLELGHVAKADGRWRLYAFAPTDPAPRHRRCADHPAGLPRLAPPGADIDSVIDYRAIFQQGHLELALESMPPLLIPAKGRYGLRDYEKIFCPDLKNGPDIFELRRVDRDRGCLVLVRPDQYVAHILPLEATGALAEFCARFMLASPRPLAELHGGSAIDPTKSSVVDNLVP